MGNLRRQGRRAHGQAQRIRPLRSLPAIGVFLEAGRAKGARRTTRSRKCNPCASYSHYKTCGQQRARGAGPPAENATVTQPNSHCSNSEQQGALRARRRRARSRNAPLAQPTAIGTTEGSWGRQGRGAQGQEQKMRPLRSLQPLERLRAAGGAKGAGRRAANKKCDP